MLGGRFVVSGIRCNLLVTVRRRLDVCGCSVYWLLILRDQLVVGSLGLIYLVAASGYNYLAPIK